MAKILLIDDDAELRHFLHDELGRHGHQVDCLECAEHGPDMLAGARFDLVLLDNKMPSIYGLEFLDALRRRGLEVPVILITGYATTDTAMEAMNLGAFDYVIKPDDFQGLVRELRPLIAAALEIAQPVAEVRLPVESPADPEAGPMLVGTSKPMMEVAKLTGCVARSDDAVLILGETGSGKELWRGPSIPAARARTNHSSPSTVPPSMRTCWRASCSATSRVPSLGRTSCAKASSSTPMAALSSSTRSATCRCPCRPSCCACSNTSRSSAWAATTRSRSTCACCRRRTATWTKLSPRASFAATYSIGSTE